MEVEFSIHERLSDNFTLEMSEEADKASLLRAQIVSSIILGPAMPKIIPVLKRMIRYIPAGRQRLSIVIPQPTENQVLHFTR
jgi:hypothetical protein